MRYLLDTQVLIWYLEDSENIPIHIKKLITNEKNSKYVCSASLWEITIKIKLNKLKLSFDLSTLYQKIHAINIPIIDIRERHLLMYKAIDFFHKDPFDRLIISTAKADNIALITSDKIIHKYNISTIW